MPNLMDQRLSLIVLSRTTARDGIRIKHNTIPLEIGANLKYAFKVEKSPTRNSLNMAASWMVSCSAKYQPALLVRVVSINLKEKP